jgi:hypothetical protein
MNPGIFVALSFPLIIIALGLYYRHKKEELIHRERLIALEKGVDLPIEQPRPIVPMDPTRRYLLSGLIWLLSGIAVSIFLFALSSTMPHRDFTSLQDRQAKMEALRNLGASDRELRMVLYDEGRHQPEIPIGVGTAGFIPIAIGLAYLIFYFSERKRGGGEQ